MAIDIINMAHTIRANLAGFIMQMVGGERKMVDWEWEPICFGERGEINLIIYFLSGAHASLFQRYDTYYTHWRLCN